MTRRGTPKVLGADIARGLRLAGLVSEADVHHAWGSAFERTIVEIPIREMVQSRLVMEADVGRFGELYMVRRFLLQRISTTMM